MFGNFQNFRTREETEKRKKIGVEEFFYIVIFELFEIFNEISVFFVLQKLQRTMQKGAHTSDLNFR